MSSQAMEPVIVKQSLNQHLNTGFRALNYISEFNLLGFNSTFTRSPSQPCYNPPSKSPYTTFVIIVGGSGGGSVCFCVFKLIIIMNYVS